MSTPLAITGGVLLAVIVVFGSLYGYINSLQQTDVNYEVQLSRSYESLKSTLDNYIAKAREQAGVTTAQSAAFDKIMSDAVQGRYQIPSGSTAQPGQGQLFSAIVEAYPNLSGINQSYSQILDTISGGRDAFNNGQQRLQDQLRQYDQWRKSGFVRSWVIANVIGAPTSNLVVQNGHTITGQAAYTVMSNVITSSTTQNSFNTGTLQPQNFFGN